MFLVLGGAGSIGQAVTKEIFKRNPKKLHVVDISENNLVELVRDVRSSFGYIDGDFKTFALDIGSKQYDAFWNSDGNYDFVLNLSALKHVRSEKDPFTLMRMVEVNILNTLKTVRQAKAKGINKYFCVSTDKAANPVNMMGASKRIMELFLMRESDDISISMARFANVAFSDGSLLHGFNQRIQKKQPIVAPNDIKRYFVTPQESGELCLMSCLLGENKDIFFPKLSEELHLITFSEIAENYLKALDYTPFICDSEEQARQFFNGENQMPQGELNYWPCFFSQSDTTGEKDFEEFFMDGETLDLDRFENLGIVKSSLSFEGQKLDEFLSRVGELMEKQQWTKIDLVEIFHHILPSFQHMETGKYLDAKM
ncbi:UDP-N-acetylglucosamine 4,6-dehydratase [Algoriphagus sp. PAP.12]|uniref:UDP-N-acetylglucosamine 4,6-dehydratase n=1 Tax=Algoriphagus sp. PAP.12 TaxID=2996678 RepID=UPI00227AFF72|nr:UDP-N-acetylglucosamine 4,6-dehydratase [Algoriphagus sp. PAP.12]